MASERARRGTRMTALVAALTLLLAACGGDDDGDSDAAGDGEPIQLTGLVQR
ncbi:MAG: hypothetical protein ACRDKB_04720 [Actinomycetota bacterium]